MHGRLHSHNIANAYAHAYALNSKHRNAYAHAYARKVQEDAKRQADAAGLDTCDA